MIRSVRTINKAFKERGLNLEVKSALDKNNRNIRVFYLYKIVGVGYQMLQEMYRTTNIDDLAVFIRRNIGIEV